MQYIQHSKTPLRKEQNHKIRNNCISGKGHIHEACRILETLRVSTPLSSVATECFRGSEKGFMVLLGLAEPIN